MNHVRSQAFIRSARGNRPPAVAWRLLALALAVLALAVAGCGSDPDEPTSTADTTDTAVEPAPVDPAGGDDEPAKVPKSDITSNDLPLIPAAKVVDEWTAASFNFPDQAVYGRLTQLRKGSDEEAALADQKKLLDRAGWTVAELEADWVLADAIGDCDPRVFSVVGDDASLEALNEGRILVADSPEGKIRAVFYVGKARGTPNFMYRARGEWIEMGALRAVDGGTVLTIATPREFSRGLLWGNFTDGLGPGVERDDSEACREDLKTEPFEIG